MISNYLLFFLITLLVYTNGISRKSRDSNHLFTFFDTTFNNRNNLNGQLTTQNTNYNNSCKGPLTQCEYNALWSFSNATELGSSLCYGGFTTNSTTNKTIPIINNYAWYFDGTNFDSPCNWNNNNTQIICSTLITNSNYCTISTLRINDCKLNGTISSSIGNLTSLEVFEISESLSESVKDNYLYDFFTSDVWGPFINEIGLPNIIPDILIPIKTGVRGPIPPGNTI